MPRRARLAVPGVPWHIIQRGNNRGACFYAEDDYLLYLEILKEQAVQYGCAIHAYVLMTNHIHLLLTPEERDSAALLMKHLGQRYVQYINRTYNRSGTLWDGRFRSCLTQDEEYVLTCYRYIEMNPVRARIATHPRDYRWTSYHGNSSETRLHGSLLTPHPEYLRLGNTVQECSRVYRGLFREPLGKEKIKEIRRATNGNFVLGNSRFQKAMERQLNCRVTPGKSGRPVRSF